jgi:uncharacterized integral membrane protein (TIGR00698 family)
MWTKVYLVAAATSASSPRPGRTVSPAQVLVVGLGLLTLLPWVSAGLALLAGIAVALTLGNPFATRTRPLAHKLLTASVIGLGAGMDLAVVGRVGLHGLGYTAVGIASALAIGTLLGRGLGVNRDTGLLVTVGTAICGGSAIAAVAPTIGAKDHDVSMALVSVFLLNAVALFVFPLVGHHLHMGQDAFGLWCALAIHDTSSVVGAAAQYGERALEVATSAKLARALWIVPVTFAIAMHRARAARAAGGGPATTTSAKPKRPWFIAGFVAVSALVTFIPALRSAGLLVSFGAHRLLASTLFLIGLGLTRPALRSIGVRPFAQAVLLWITLGTGTLVAITYGWIG